MATQPYATPTNATEYSANLVASGQFTQDAANTLANQVFKPTTSTPSTTPTSSAITSQSMAPVAPLTLPPAPTTNPAQTSLTQAVGTSVANAAPTTTDATPSFEDLITKLGTQSSFTTNLETEQDVAGKKKAVDAINAEILTADKAQKDSIDALYGQGGTTREQAQPAVTESTRLYNSQAADRAIRQYVANEDYKTALDIVDMKVKAEFEPVKQQIDALMKFQEYNNNDLTDSEQLKLQGEITRQNEKYQSDLELANYKAKAGFDATYPGAPTSAPSTYTLKKGDDPYYVAQQAGIDMARLQELNPKITDWHNLPVGFTLNMPTKNLDYNQTALNVILGSAKFTKDQKSDLIKSINSGQDPLTVIQNQAKNIMGQTEATTLTKYEVARDTLNDIGDELAQFYAAGGSTSLITGNFENIYSKLGTVKDPALRTLATQIQGNLQVYRNAISGTAYSAQEGKDIASIFPGINKSESLNTAILSGRSILFDSIIDSTYRSALGPVYDQLTSTPGTYQGIIIPGLSSGNSYSFAGITL